MKIQDTKKLKQGQTVYHITKKNADGTPMRAKVTSVKVWKRSPDKVLVGLKHGLYDYAKFDETDISFITTDENEVTK